MTHPPANPASEVASKLSQHMKAMLRHARPDSYSAPPRCYGRGVTKKALRDRGLGHGDFCYLTPLGLAVREYLLTQATVSLPPQPKPQGFPDA